MYILFSEFINKAKVEVPVVVEGNQQLQEAVIPSSVGWYVYDSANKCVAGPKKNKHEADEISFKKGDALFSVTGYYVRFLDDNDLKKLKSAD